MSMYADWDLVYGLTYQALNRKLGRLFDQQLTRKHRVKQLVAQALDPERKGIRAGYTTRIARPGTYDVSTPPTLEVSFYGPQLQGQQHTAAGPVAVAGLDGSGRLATITPQQPVPPTLFYPPGIEVRRHPADPNAGSPDNAVVLTGLALNPQPLPTAGPSPLKQVLADWLAEDTSTADKKLLSVLNRHFTRADATAAFNQAKRTARQLVLGLPDSTTLAACCGELLEHLVTQVWAGERFWKSSYLQVLSGYDAATASEAELQALYAYAQKLRRATPVAAIRKSTSRSTLQAAIKPVYEYYRTSEVARLRREVVFRVQEALFGVDFDFSTHTLAEQLLSAPLANNSPLLMAVMQALLEAFACLEPTVMPDLLFGARGLGSGAAEAFSLRLGPWQIADSLFANKFRLLVPVLGGTYYQQATGEQQVLNDASERRLNLEFSAEYFARAHQDSGLELVAFDLATSSYFAFNSPTEGPNPLVPATYPYTAHPPSGLLASDEVKAFFQNYAPPAPDAARHGDGFAYSYTPLFSAFTVLNDLPVPQDHLYANMSWAKVTEYRFIFWTNTTVAGTLTGQLYVCGTVRPAGTTTKAPITEGGELNNLGADNDAVLFVSRSLLMANLFLPGLAGMFHKTGAAAPEAAAPDDFEADDDEIRSKVDVGISYQQLKPFLDEGQQKTFVKTLEITDESLFVVPAGGLVFRAENNRLALSFSTLKYQELITLTGLSYSFSYSFVRQNGVDRYQLLGTKKGGELKIDYRAFWDYVDEWGTQVAIGATVLFGGAMAGYSWYKTRQGLRMLVAAENEHPGRHEVERLIERLGRAINPPAPEPEPVPAPAPAPVPVTPFQADDSAVAILGRGLSDGTPEYDPEAGEFRRTDARVHPMRQAPPAPALPPALPPALSAEEQALQKTARQYGGYVYKYLGHKVREQDGLCFFLNRPLVDDRLTHYQHKLSLQLHSVEKSRGVEIVYVTVKLTDYRSAPAAGAPHPENHPENHPDKRQVLLEYRYYNNEVNSLEYIGAEPLDEQSDNDFYLSAELNTFRATSRIPRAPQDEMTQQDNEQLRTVMDDKLKQEFRDELWRTLLRTAALRAQADDRWGTLWVNGAGILGVVSPWALVLWNSLVQGQAAKKGGLTALFGNPFIEALLRSQLDLLKYPYDEHFTVNAVRLDADGLKVRMGATTSATLTFGQDLPRQQSASTYLNVRDLTAITLSVTGLQDPQFNRRATAGSIGFRLQFAFAGPPASNQAPGASTYTPVGNAVGFTLRAARAAAGNAWTWKLALPPDATGTDTLPLPLAGFGRLEGANVLLLTRLENPEFEHQERNTVAVQWE